MASRLGLADLPDAAAATLVSFLDSTGLRAVALSSRDVPPPLEDAFQRRFALRIPPDARRHALLVELIQSHAATSATPPPHQRLKAPPSPRPCVLPSHFVIANTQTATAVLGPVRSHVRGLALSSDEYTAWPVQPLEWDVVAMFPSLTRLEIDHVWNEPVDLRALSASAPHLTELVIKRARKVTNRLVGLRCLRVLHLEDTNVDSFTIAVGLTGLQSLALLLKPSGRPFVRDALSLALVAPLQRLVVRGMWDMCPSDAVQAHADTLREYVELDNTFRYNLLTWNKYHPDWSVLTHLRSLRTGRFHQTDLQPLATLRSLEHLQLVVSRNATHCRPLRHLVRLRELQIADGWVCDLVGYLPRLEMLVWEDGLQGYHPGLSERKTLRRRDWPDVHDGNDAASVRRSTNGEGVGLSVGLRHLVLRGEVSVMYDDDDDVYAMVEHIEQLEDCVI